MKKKEFLKREFIKLTEFYADYISAAEALGYNMTQIANILYDDMKISYWEKDLLGKGEILWKNQD